MSLQKYLNRFQRRERRQGRHLAKALRGRYQKTFRRPRKELRRLGLDAKASLNAHNPHSRIALFAGVAKGLCKHLNIRPPYWTPPATMYFLTIIDRRQVQFPDHDDPRGRKARTLVEIRETYRQMMRGLLSSTLGS